MDIQLIIDVKRSVCHPQYDENTMVADICLLQLATRARCGDALQEEHRLVTLDTPETSAGFTEVCACDPSMHTPR